MLQGGQILAARYVLLRRLGDGRTTQTWQARDRDTGSDRVLKILATDDPDELAAFHAAARLQQRFDDPGLQPCEAVFDGPPSFAVLGRVADGDLAALRGRPWPQLLPVLAAIADALDVLHRHGVVHRDLKPANVLIGEHGVPVLADFGLAALAGDERAPRGGSPFSMSPQQLDGLPPAPADDLYAFGTLAYEMLGGYPPFYPDAAPQRVSNELPQALPARLQVPPALERLVMQCLAKDPAQRPATAAQIAAELHVIARQAPSPAAMPAAPVQLAPPRVADATLDAQWQRSVATEPTPQQWRSQGFRRGLVAASLVFLLLAGAFVFFVLPRQVEQRSAAPVANAPPPVAAAAVDQSEKSPDLERLAAAMREFEELRPALATRIDALEQQAAGQWGGEAFARGKQGLAAADTAFGSRDYVSALATLRVSETDVAATERQRPVQLRTALADGAAAIDAGDAAGARRQFELALIIEPGNAAAARGLERAGTLPEVRKLLADAALLEQQGQAPAAAALYRKALALDRDTQAAYAALVRLEAQATGSAFAAAMSQGLDGLARDDFAPARAAFERAARLRPGAPEVADGLAQAERGLAGRSIEAHLAAARQAERDERWSVALVEYRKALDIDRNLLAARQGIERAEPRAMLDAELGAFIERPERLFSSEVRGAARVTLQNARAIPAAGPVLSRQVDTVARLLEASETPVRVALTSDNVTDVTIYRVGRLGSFERKDVELLPGRYTVVGVRAGYRDVRHEIRLVPGRDAPTVVIRCEEPI
jgi:tetratricopeptide (TPR) repeat protein